MSVSLCNQIKFVLLAMYKCVFSMCIIVFVNMQKLSGHCSWDKLSTCHNPMQGSGVREQIVFFISDSIYILKYDMINPVLALTENKWPGIWFIMSTNQWIKLNFKPILPIRNVSHVYFTCKKNKQKKNMAIVASKMCYTYTFKCHNV